MAQPAQARPVARSSSKGTVERGEKLGSLPHASSSSGAVPVIAANSRRNAILEATRAGDTAQLRRMADGPGGYETDELRRIVWPLLLGCRLKGKQRQESNSLHELPIREDERQVQLDIARSLINYPANVTESERDDLRLRLEKAILTVLRKHPALQYFQGYHDIVSILLLTLDDDDLLASVAEQMSLHRIRDSMGPGLEPTLGYLKLAHRLVQRVDPDLYALVNQAASMPFFALSWALTLFSHDLYEVAVIARLFDFLLAHNPAMISYLVVALLMTKKADLLDCLDQEDNDPAMVHSVLSQLPNIVLSEAEPLQPMDTSTSSAGTLHHDANEEDCRSEAESETLLSSPSLSTSDLSSQLTSAGSSSTLNVSDSFISVPQATPPSPTAYDSTPASLRHRRKLNRADRFSFSSFDSDIHALDDSMLSDPDVENPAFSAFTSSVSLSARECPPAQSDHLEADSPSSPECNGSRAPVHSEYQYGPPRTVLVEDLIQSALKLWRTYPLVSPHDQDPLSPTAAVSLSDTSSSVPGLDPSDQTSPAQSICPSPFSMSSSLRANTILGPKSCVFTYQDSIAGRLSDEEAEGICSAGVDIVMLEALLPDSEPTEDRTDDNDDDVDDDDDDDHEDGDQDDPEEEDGFELVGTTTKGDRGGDENQKNVRRRRRRRRNPPTTIGGGQGLLYPSSVNGRINLGPHGWLVVGGVAVATAVAYGVYGARAGANARGTGAGGLTGLGTGGLGLRTGFGVPVLPNFGGNGVGSERPGRTLKDWAKSATEL